MSHETINVTRGERIRSSKCVYIPLVVVELSRAAVRDVLLPGDQICRNVVVVYC
jgi:hypothetical protein